MTARGTAADIAALTALAILVATVFFAGYGLGDDAAYTQLAAQLLDHGYPPVEGTNVFASRPVLLYLMATSLRLFSWSELAYVLPVIVAGVASILAVYVIAAHVAGRRAGWVAAAALALSPLHLAFTTTFCNDILAAGFGGTGVALILATRRCATDRWTVATATVGGVLAGASVAVKLSAALLLAPVAFGLAASAWFSPRGWQRRDSAAVAGFAVACLALLVFFWITAGQPLAGVKAELAFNRTHLLPLASERSLREMLMFYPRVASGLPYGGPSSYAWSPAGLLFPLALIAAFDLARKRVAAAIVIAAVGLAMFALLEFWPLQVLPHYVPIHRLPRFLYPIALPAAVLIGVALNRWWSGGAVAKSVAVSILVVYAATGLWWGGRAVAFHNDVMGDPRFAGLLALRWNGPVMADEELQPYLWFLTRNRTERAELVPLGDGVRVPAGTLALVGGTRRPELDPGLSARSMPSTIPGGWIKVADMPGVSRPWRPIRGAAYAVVAETPGRVMGDSPIGCPAGPQWVLTEVVDVGDTASEAAHAYAIERQTWSGDRVLRLGHTLRWDDGRAFVGSQGFRVDALIPGADLCIVKRVDGGVAPQTSIWTVDDQDVPASTFANGPPGAWGSLVVAVPGRLVGNASVIIRERFVSSAVDVNAFRVEIYQARSTEPRGARRVQ